ncbi:hypothetical protein GCM10011575_10520 [Microlunatus endophyticus]|uniref:Sulfotransferase family protein n=1 Tax=Microlunatus endophyticus TaxID=1716077 RepID=A0A917S522_9ACTN|nr:hypothetical protein [Microlunatus endophyticus]GGL54011.1 hypothetical protein GCM10011575_10520 [Microlunatus endophyticus]
MKSGPTGLPAMVLHIGPHKTGTTTLQAGLGQNRASLREQGVVYPGRQNHELNAATAVSSRTVEPGQSVETSTAAWFEMLDEIRSSGARLGVLSSEFYSETPQERIEWLLERLGSDVQVVITLRPLASILPSQWQQYIQNRLVYPWDEWLQAILSEPRSGKITPTFWLRHRHDLLVRRWVEVAGRERVTVIAVDERDPEFVVRSFEELLDVVPGTLTPRDLRSNRSLALEEVELVRRFNQLYRSAGYTGTDYTTLIRYGAIRRLQEQPVAAGSHSIRLPGWAAQRAGEIARMMVTDIIDSGVKIMGPIRDLDRSARTPADNDPAVDNPTIDSVSADLAARLTVGLVETMGRYTPTRPPDPERAPVLTAIDRRNREQRAAERRRRTESEIEALRHKIDSVRRQIANQPLVAEATRRDLFSELRRRALRRLRPRR